MKTHNPTITLHLQALQHPETNPDQYIHHPDPAIRAAVASQTKTETTLTHLANDTSDTVRNHVARNPHTPAPVIHQLAQDQNKNTTILAAAHPNITDNTLNLILKQAETDETYNKKLCDKIKTITTDRKISPKLVTHLINETHPINRGATPNLAGCYIYATDPTVADAYIALLARSPEHIQTEYATHLITHVDATYPPLVKAIKNTLESEHQGPPNTAIKWWSGPPKEAPNEILDLLQRAATSSQQPEYLDRIGHATNNPFIISTLINNPHTLEQTINHIITRNTPEQLNWIIDHSSHADTHALNIYANNIEHMLKSDNLPTLTNALMKLAHHAHYTKQTKTISKIVEATNTNPALRTTPLIEFLGAVCSKEDIWNLPPSAWNAVSRNTAQHIIHRLQKECGQTGANIAYGLANEWENTTSALAETAKALAQNQQHEQPPKNNRPTTTPTTETPEKSNKPYNKPNQL